ncbi:uncharacterized protein PHACADRAFT_123712 [Phanerochaete carnosa HHB-10118-sp]|uniref:Uncharacterized protein n=1 Tax=Phanerochaete carnosa (strain HHB-10118-sp) TaxID=650164 RepID=K5W6G3_PHACS|nr:uncharacterized protein PHACADRAFT_123712 [Phanerochaete carnosa HHB-10118-sp]EKM54539.1 hypothetical protein PHACADRAFT_123712 [Phanerochaete carnosa HHB-10118-sp]
MSDNFRESFTDKAGAAIKPDSEKSTTEHLGDKLKGNADSAASTVQPASQKSTTQQVGDAVSGNSNEGTQVMCTRCAWWLSALTSSLCSPRLASASRTLLVSARTTARKVPQCNLYH